MKILCVVCTEEVSESEYPLHMSNRHPQGQLASLNNQKNIPKTANLPPGVSPKDLPDPEFLKTVREIEQAATQIPPKPQAAIHKESPLSAPVAERKLNPIIIEYKFKGDCPTCYKPIETLIVDVPDKCAAIAWCNEHKQIKSYTLPYIYTIYEVPKLDKPLIPKNSGLGNRQPKVMKKIVERFEKEAKDNGAASILSNPAV